MKKGGPTLYRAAAVILVFVVVVFAVRLGEEPVRAVHKPEVRPAPETFETLGAGSASDPGEHKVGAFETPEYVPDYEILEKSLDARDSAFAVRLLIDTRSRREEYFALIARDLKARYSDYDAVSVEFTDTEDLLFYNEDLISKDLLPYNGGALIFNTYDGALYLGYVYGPPNMEGYYVSAAD
jgi:hypothetical protein